jgi:tRNA (cmo5U34)-methyltransferase
LALLQRDRPHLAGVGLDSSEPMLAAARDRFSSDGRIVLVERDMVHQLPRLGRFGAVVFVNGNHHLDHDRKRSLYAEVFELLEPGGVFANFEHVAPPTQRLHIAFFAAIGVPLEHEDPSDHCSQSRLSCVTGVSWAVARQRRASRRPLSVSGGV